MSMKSTKDIVSRGIIYCRVSSQEQVQGTSLDGQREACIEFAESKNIKVKKIFIEKGESATAANRTELIKALDYCRENKNKIDAFIVWKIDRFARNMTDHYALQAQLLKYGTRLQSVTEPMINDGPMGKPMFKQLVERMLRNKYYAGILVNPWDGEEYIGLHRPMISKEEYDKIQFLKSGRSNNATLTRLVMNTDFPLKGLVTCLCRSKYTASWQTGRGKKYPYYRCNNSECEFYNRNVGREDLEEMFYNFLIKVTPTKKFMAVFKENAIRQWKSEKNMGVQHTKSYDQELKHLKIRLENLKEMREGGEYTKEEFLERKEKLENQITGL